jgi:hypothetical protein
LVSALIDGDQSGDSKSTVPPMAWRPDMLIAGLPVSDRAMCWRRVSWDVFFEDSGPFAATVLRHA